MIVVKHEDELTQFVLDTFALAAKNVFDRASERARQSAADLADDKAYAYKNKQVLHGDHWQAAHKDEQARIAAHRIVAATLEIKLNEG